MQDPAGTPARRAALRMLDAVLRRGETLDQAEAGATKSVHGFADKALARAIAAEVLRWLVDLDALIDSATKQNLPDDAKARMVLRIMLAQALRLDGNPLKNGNSQQGGFDVPTGVVFDAVRNRFIGHFVRGLGTDNTSTVQPTFAEAFLDRSPQDFSSIQTVLSKQPARDFFSMVAPGRAT